MIVVINNCDSKIIKDNEYEFYELGFQNYLKVSGEQGNGIYDLLESIKNIINIKKMMSQQYFFLLLEDKSW